MSKGFLRDNADIIKYNEVAVEIVKKHGGKAETGELALPVTQTKSFLPCGASARWTADNK